MAVYDPTRKYKGSRAQGSTVLGGVRAPSSALGAGSRVSTGVYRATGSRGALGGGSSAAAPGGRSKTPTISSQKFEMPELPGGGAPSVTPPERPDLPPIDPTGAELPEHKALRERYTQFGEDLKEGTGFAMDVLQGQLADEVEAQVEMARQNAANLGIPFDEAAFRAELKRGSNAALAQEKLGREQLYQSHLSDIAPVLAGAEYRQGEKQIDLSRDVAEQEGILQRYGTDVSRYGTELQAAARANEMLMDFYKSLMTGMMSFNAGSFTGGDVSFS